MRMRPGLVHAVLTASFLLPILGTAQPPAFAAGRVLYVAPWGADYNPDGWSTASNSYETPWRTLAVSFRRLRPGDTLVVRGGTYREPVGWGITRGTSSARIRVVRYQGERPLIEGTLKMVRADYWTIDGINVTRDASKPRTQYLVAFVGGTGWQFLNGEVWGTIGVSNIMITGNSTDGYPRGYRLAGNCIHDNKATGDAFMNDHNIYLYPGYGSGPGTIERNIFFNAPNGGHIKAAGPTSSTGASYVTIRYNTMVRGATGVIVGYGTHHVTLVRNLVGSRWGGNTTSYNAAFVGNHVSGAENKADYNAVFAYGKTISNTSDSSRPIRNLGHNIWTSPGFDGTSSCSGFHPSNATAAKYGRYAP